MQIACRLEAPCQGAEHVVAKALPFGLKDKEIYPDLKQACADFQVLSLQQTNIWLSGVKKVRKIRVNQSLPAEIYKRLKLAFDLRRRHWTSRVPSAT